MGMTYYAVTDDPNELAHYGVLGMKWGVTKERPRHTGSRSNKPRSAAYKNAQNKLGKMMKSGIKKAEAHWKAYNSPKAKEARFMKKAMQQARNGTLKYGKLTDDQVRRVTDRLYLEKQARGLGSTENPRFAKRVKMAVGQGIVEGFGRGTSAYIEERFRGRGRTTADIKSSKRMLKYESDRDVMKQKAKNKINSEYYEEAARRGYTEPTMAERLLEGKKSTKTSAERAKRLAMWKDYDKRIDAKEAEREKRRSAYMDTYLRKAAERRAMAKVPDGSGKSGGGGGGGGGGGSGSMSVYIYGSGSGKSGSGTPYILSKKKMKKGKFKGRS